MEKKKYISDISDYLGTDITVSISDEVEIVSGYCCDMLSYALAKLDRDTCWITIMNSINVIAVAKSTGCRCIILADGIKMSEDVLVNAELEAICILSSPQSAFILAGELYEYLKQ